MEKSIVELVIKSDPVIAESDTLFRHRLINIPIPENNGECGFPLENGFLNAEQRTSSGLRNEHQYSWNQQDDEQEDEEETGKLHEWLMINDK